MNTLKNLLLGSAKTQHSPLMHTHGSTESTLPILDIQNGLVLTKDGRYVKILEILPVNFNLKSNMEQENIIYSFALYLKVAPDNIQIKVLTQKANIAGYIEQRLQYKAREQNEKCKELIDDNIWRNRIFSKNKSSYKKIFSCN